jgi:hypothetical protein
VRIAIAAVFLFTACAPVARPDPSPRSPVATATAATATPTPTPRDSFAATPTASPTPFAPPAARLEDPLVTMTSDPFPVLATFALVKSAVSPGDTELASRGVQYYLEGLDRYRDNGDFLPVTGAFGTAVAKALVESRTPGVKRTFVLESLRIETLYRKPWGTLAMADVRVTIVDHAVDGSAPDQREAGLLRLSGDRRLNVIDSWDTSTGRWFNGHVPENPAGLRAAVVQPIGWHLRTESWVAGLPAETYWDGAGATPFQKARAAYLATLDRAAIRTRTFDTVTATIERFDTFAEMAGGMATVRVAATLVTTDSSGRTQRQGIARRVKVFFGNWSPEVVDEEVTPGVWRSGGDLALIDIDVNRA